MFIPHEIIICTEVGSRNLGKNKANPTHYLNQNVTDGVEAKILAEDYLSAQISQSETLVWDAPYQVNELNYNGETYWSVTLWVDTPGTCPLNAS